SERSLRWNRIRVFAVIVGMRPLRLRGKGHRRNMNPFTGIDAVRKNVVNSQCQYYTAYRSWPRISDIKLEREVCCRTINKNDGLISHLHKIHVNPQGRMWIDKP